MPDLYLFADTNLFLQCKVLQEIDWSQLGTFHHIEVVVCRTVQLEIDALKDARDGRRSDRARRTASKLLQAAENGPQQERVQSPRVTINLYAPGRLNRDLENDLDYDLNDNRIIAHLAQFKAEYPAFDVRLITGDSGMVLTAKQLGFPYVITPDHWRLPPEPDARDRQIQELRQQIQELRAQEPEFDFSYDQESAIQPRRVTIPYEAFQPLTEQERDQLVERLRSFHPPTVTDRLFASTDDISKYEQEKYPAWIDQCKEYMQVAHYIAQSEHLPELTINIQNAGSRPANNTLVELHTSENFGLTPPLAELRNLSLIPLNGRPIPPPQPKSALSWLQTLARFNDFPHLDHEALVTPAIGQDQEDFLYTQRIKLEPEPSIGLTSQLWRHAMEPRQFTIRLVPQQTNTPATGQITCTVHADNLTKPATYNLVVTVSPEQRPTLEPAFNWFVTPHPDE